tara:strand:- start:772 stop:1068 length:297 start_codon:yes stop_codon:yes gene_type:complete
MTFLADAVSVVVTVVSWGVGDAVSAETPALTRLLTTRHIELARMRGLVNMFCMMERQPVCSDTGREQLLSVGNEWPNTEGSSPWLFFPGISAVGASNS